jgi:branched-chain amino acid transport system permease protein
VSHGRADERGRAASLLGSDAALVVAAMTVIYAIFTLVGLSLGYDANGVLSVLGQVTFYTAVYALAVLALNLQWGYTGLFNIGVAGFMAVGVYSMAMLSGSPAGNPPGLGLPLWIGVPGGMLAAALVGFLAALPALRLRADYLAITTVAISEIIRLTYNSPAFSAFTVGGVSLGTGGASGFGALPTNPVRAIFYVEPSNPASDPTVVGRAIFEAVARIGLTREAVVVDATYALVLVALVGAVYGLLVRIGDSPFGRVLKAIREDELVAQSLGKDTRLFKIKVFALGCALMGLAGIVWQGAINAVYPQSFRPELTFYVFIALIIGGAGSNTGSVLGGALFASLLFLGPQYVPDLINRYAQISARPPTFPAAVAAATSGEPIALVGYVVENIFALRFVLVGALLVYLMQNRPEGLLGHRTEEAAAVDLSARRTDGRDSDREEVEER